VDYKALNLIGSSSPHIRTRDGAGHIMGEVLIALVLPLAFGVYNFGPRALAAAAVSVAGCCAFELLCRLLLHKNNTLGDLSAAVTGLLIAMVSPVTTPYWILLAGDFFAIVVVKQLFGGLGQNFLNPALAGRAFLMLCYPVAMTTWVLPGVDSWAGIVSAAHAVTGASPAPASAQASARAATASPRRARWYVSEIDMRVFFLHACLFVLAGMAEPAPR